MWRCNCIRIKKRKILKLKLLTFRAGWDWQPSVGGLSQRCEPSSKGSRDTQIADSAFETAPKTNLGGVLDFHTKSESIFPWTISCVKK